MARRVNMHLDDDFADCIELHKPKSLALAAFCALLIEEALDKRAETQTMGEPAARRASSKAVSSSKNSFNKTLSMSIPAELEPERQLIEEFWRIKKGSKGETAWKLLMTELDKIRTKHGLGVVREQLQLAINGKWQGITLKNYEQFSAPKGNAPAQPETRHPASRVFTADRGFDDEPITNPVLKELF
jgi:hypothetical protein